VQPARAGQLARLVRPRAADADLAARERHRAAARAGRSQQAHLVAVLVEDRRGREAVVDPLLGDRAHPSLLDSGI
jgi:hypothetical protein